MRYSVHLFLLLSYPIAFVSAWTAFSGLFRRPNLELTATRRPFISGNWKLNPQTRDEAVQLAKDIASSVPTTSSDRDVALFVPYVFIESAMNAVDNKLMVGAEVSDYVHICLCVSDSYHILRMLSLSLTMSYTGRLSGNSRGFYGSCVGQYAQLPRCAMGPRGTFGTSGHLW